jgi:uncharacterized repeat protein (TIGR03943 family)
MTGPRAELQGVILTLAGGTLLRIALDGDYTRYVKASAKPYLLAAGVVLAAVGLITLVQALRRRPYERDPAQRDHEEHRHGRFDVAWLLAAPAAALLLFAPQAIGSYQAVHAGSALPPAPTSPYPPLAPPDAAGDPTSISVVDYASRAVFDHGKSLGARMLAMTGFLTKAPSGWYLTRMVVTCCAADAAAIKVGIDGAVPAGAADDTWVRLVGAYEPRTEADKVNGAVIPYVAASDIAVVSEPANPYES